MLKLSASYSKKVPAEREYSSQSYHVSLEVELPAGMTGEQIQGKISETFSLARDSVEREIQGVCPPATHGGAPRLLPAAASPANQSFAPAAPSAPPAAHPNGNGNGGQGNQNDPASNKQVAFLADLLNRNGYSLPQILQQRRIASLYDLTRRQCSAMIKDLQEKGVA